MGDSLGHRPEQDGKLLELKEIVLFPLGFREAAHPSLFFVGNGREALGAAGPGRPCVARRLVAGPAIHASGGKFLKVKGNQGFSLNIPIAHSAGKGKEE